MASHATAYAQSLHKHDEHEHRANSIRTGLMATAQDEGQMMRKDMDVLPKVQQLS